ncbi:MAG: MOSC domain-containing protein [Rhodothermales bacterium]|nr:MOSC domain-containing protein [Rhodothermales bacterium]
MTARPWRGTVAALSLAPEAGAPMRSVQVVRAVPGRGLEGDRYFDGAGSFSRWPGPHRDLTLIAEEDLAAMQAEGIHLAPEASRRNVLVRGVPLNDLVGRPFCVGTVTVRGERLCQPCKYLARLTGEPGLLPAMIGRGGLRARILTEGVLHVGDEVSERNDEG